MVVRCVAFGRWKRTGYSLAWLRLGKQVQISLASKRARGKGRLGEQNPQCILEQQ